MIETRKMLAFLLLTSFVLNSSFFATGEVTGSMDSIKTCLSAWPGDYQYLEGENIQLEVSVWDVNGQPVETGEITVVDLNGSTIVQANVASYLTLISWTAVLDGVTGIHQFEVMYSDPTDQYLPSSLILELLLGLEVIPGEKRMAITLGSLSYTLIKGQSVTLGGDLLSSGMVFPYFYIDAETACLTVEAEIEGNWRILNTNYPVTDITASYGIEMAFVLPPWIPAGPVTARCAFSGSGNSDLANTTALFTINLLQQEKSIVLLADQLTVERNNLTEQNFFPVEIQVPGFDSDPVAVNIDLLAENGSLVTSLLIDHLLTGYSSQLLLGIPRDISIGTYNLSATLIDWQTGVNLAVDSVPVTVTDDLLVDNFYWNLTGQLIKPGQSVQGYLVSREEDTFLAVKASLKVQVAGTGDILFEGITGDSGYIPFSFTVPLGLSPGSHVIEFSVIPLPGDLFHHQATKNLSVIVQRKTTIVHQESPFLVRLQEGWFNATAVDESGLPVNGGTLYLTLNGESLFAASKPVAAFRYLPPASTPRGVNIFTWHYSGTDIYESSEITFPVPVYSLPVFINISFSFLEVFPGDEVEISGNLVDESGKAIPRAPVNITYRNNWNSISQSVVLTDEGGWFSFMFSPGDGDSGTHFFTVEFNGWSEEHYLPVAGKLVFEVSVAPPLSLSVNGELVAGESATLGLHGKPEQEIVFELLAGENWQEIDTIVLDAGGNGEYSWLVPGYLRGEVFLRAGYSNGIGTAVFTVNIKVRPQIDVQVPDSPIMTDKEFIVVITCNEIHSIWLDGELWQNALSPGTRHYLLVFAEAGDHYLEIRTGSEDIVETVSTATFQVREDYSITVDMPTRVQKGASIRVVVTTRNSNGPLEGFTASLFLNGTLMASAKTSTDGKAVMDVSLMVGSYEVSVMVTSSEPNVYASKEIELEGLTVYNIPSIEILDVNPVKGRVVDVEIRLTDGLDPVSGETVFLHLKSFTGNVDDFIGSNVTDDHGRAEITWNVTRDSGDYLLQVKNQGNGFLESIVITKTVHVQEEGPRFVQVEVVTLNSEQNLYLVTAVIEFAGGKGNVYLRENREGAQIDELLENGNFWTLTVQLEKGTHDLWLQAVDAAGIDSWYALGTIDAMNDLQNDPETDGTADNNPLLKAVEDTLLSAMFLLPVAGVIVYKKRKKAIKML